MFAKAFNMLFPVFKGTIFFGNSFEFFFCWKTDGYFDFSLPIRAPRRSPSNGRLSPTSPVQTILWSDQTGVPIHFHSSVISGSASRISARMRARVSPHHPSRSRIRWSMSLELITHHVPVPEEPDKRHSNNSSDETQPSRPHSFTRVRIRSSNRLPE